MTKDGFMTPKAIANRIKSKGLQKLRWYCQMCQKQCRDENGFKCHTKSESHQRQMGLFASSPGSFLSTFNHEFEKGFLDILKRRFGEKRVFANLVYNEYISDKNHAHMNATSWTSLSGFVRFLGKTGKAEIEETPKGWYIKYIDRDPERLAREEALAKKEKMDVDDDERIRRLIEKRIEETQKSLQQTTEGGEQQGQIQGVEPSSPTDPAQLEPVKFSLGFKKEAEAKQEPTDEPKIKIEPIDVDTARAASPDGAAQRSSLPPDSKPTIKPITTPKFSFGAESKSGASSSANTSQSNDKKRKLTAVEELMLEQEKKKERHNRKDYWITPGIVVKILNKALASGKYYKQKGVIEQCPSTYVAQIKMIDFGDVLKLDQSQLETAIGGKVKIVNGAYRGDVATLQSLDVDKFSAKVKLVSGINSGKVVHDLAYEDICKLA